MQIFVFEPPQNIKNQLIGFKGAHQGVQGGEMSPPRKKIVIVKSC